MPVAGKTAMDQAAKGFFQRYPNAARVTTGGGLWACQPERTPRKPQTVAQDEAFFNRFPNLAKVA
jgi:hypothetical protein